MANRTKSVKILRHKENHNVAIDIYVSFDSGGYGRSKGYYLHIQPVKYEGNFTSYNPMDGFRMYLAPAPRFNQKGFDTLCDLVASDESYYKLMLEACCSKAGIKLSDYK